MASNLIESLESSDILLVGREESSYTKREYCDRRIWIRILMISGQDRMSRKDVIM